MLFFPTKYPEGDWNPVDLDFEDVWIPVTTRIEVHGWYCSCKQPRSYLLYLHGNAGNITHRAEILARLQRHLQVAILIYDYRGYGRSKGTSTVFNIVKDAQVAAKFLADKANVPPQNLIVMGRSLGGAVAIQLSRKLQQQGLIVESTFSSLRRIAAHHFSILSWLVPGSILNSRRAIRDYSGKFLLSHGKRDFTIPFEHGIEIYDAAKEPKSFFTIPNAGHNDPSPDDYIDKLGDFISELAPSDS